MKKHIRLGSWFFFAALLSPPTFAEEHKTAHWSYEGDTGPLHWSELEKNFVTCSLGKQQSPIDLKWSQPKSETGLELGYIASPLKVIDNGHTIQVNFAPGSKAQIHGHSYELVQMHFHEKSEHTFSGKHFPLELHFVHKDAGGKLAVVGVMVQEGAANPRLESIFAHFPKSKNEELIVKDVQILGTDLMPKSRTHYHYLGSLTTPPCSEDVNWNVLNTPITASKAQIESFRKHYSGNNRPIQALNGRKPDNH